MQGPVSFCLIEGLQIKGCVTFGISGAYNYRSSVTCVGARIDARIGIICVRSSGVRVCSVRVSCVAAVPGASVGDGVKRGTAATKAVVILLGTSP